MKTDWHGQYQKHIAPGTSRELLWSDNDKSRVSFTLYPSPQTKSFSGRQGNGLD